MQSECANMAGPSFSSFALIVLSLASFSSLTSNIPFLYSGFKEQLMVLTYQKNIVCQELIQELTFQQDYFIV